MKFLRALFRRRNKAKQVVFVDAKRVNLDDLVGVTWHIVRCHGEPAECVMVLPLDDATIFQQPANAG
jgi:hypothetical protein